MGTGFQGTFVISWSQTEIDGLDAAPLAHLKVGAAWSWRGDAIRVDGSNDVLRLGSAEGADMLRKRAARMVHRLVGAAIGQADLVTDAAAGVDPADMPLMDNSFIVTDGGKSYTVTLIEVGGGRQPLLMFVDQLPPRQCDLWVVNHALLAADDAQDIHASGGVICFSEGTR
ncbi:MAG: hemolysin-type calcium-binding protein, partial [Pseudomonadota bacterium]